MTNILPHALILTEEIANSSWYFVHNHGNVLKRAIVKVLEGFIIGIPSLFFRILSIKINFSVSFSSLLLFLVFVFIASASLVRYRLLTSYSRLTSDEDSTDHNQDLLADNLNISKNEETRFGSYLDEFLIAIKIFGYLEKPVFNELTKSMRTQKLDKSELLQLDEKLGFAIVVEGNVQIFTKINNNNNNSNSNGSKEINIGQNNKQSSGRAEDEYNDESEDENQTNLEDLTTKAISINGEKYQLLNEVKTGNPLSSLINILTLFTEDNAESDRDTFYTSTFSSPSFTYESSIQENNHIPSLNLSDDGSPFKSPSFSTFDSNESKLLNGAPEIIARATSDSTIAIIPANAFIRLKNKHPRSSSHIVQMILTRLYRVTFQTAHNYLGLTKEIFETEKKMNKNKINLSENVIREILNEFSKVDVNQDTKSPTSDTESQPHLRRRSETEAGSSSTKIKFKFKDKLGRLNDDTISEEINDLSCKTSIVEAMFAFLGITKESLIPNTRKGTESLMNSVLNSPVPPGFGLYATFPAIPNTREYTKETKSNSKSRTWSSSTKISNSSNGKLLDFEFAKKDFAKFIEFLQIKENSTLIEQNARSNGLYYVIDGELEAIYTDPVTKKEHILHRVQRGGVSGYLGSLVGYKSFITVRSTKKTVVGYLSKNHLEKLCEKYFMIYLTIAKSLINSLSKKLLQLDSALEWVQLGSGETLFKQDTVANGIYIILSGRFRSIYKDSQSEEIKILDEYGQGESFGEVEVLTAAKRSSTFIALRDSEAARIPRALFEILALENPSIMIKVSRIVASTVNQTKNYSLSPHINTHINTKINTNFRTITILPTTSGLPVNEFSTELIQAFKRVNRSVIGLNQASTLSHLGKHAFDKLSRLRQSGFFSDLEERFQIVVYIADASVNSSWTTSCIQQGDCILLLANANSNYQIGEYERLLLKTRRTSARTELILLHPEKFVTPGSTNKWLKNRIWVDSHHHILFNPKPKYNAEIGSIIKSSKFLPSYLVSNQLAMNIMNKVENFGLKLQELNPVHDGYTSTQTLRPYKNDFLRLARILSGQAVGVVLGGGGARGLSHLGVLKALQENGIPVDVIGGTSIGSFIGGLYAKDYDLVPLYGRAKTFAQRISNFWRMAFDLTIPTTSYTTGHEFNRGLFKAFGEYRIEDFWISYFCNSTNITNSCMEVHSTGYAWRFIRASMSLAGLLPPVVDQNGSMLLDGGYINNLPVEEMKSCSVIFACDVGSADDRTPHPPSDSISGLWILLNRWNPFSTIPRFPSLSEIQMRLCYVSSVNQLERAKVTPGVVYLRPPIDDYTTLDFGKFEEIYNVGSEYGDEILKKMIATDMFPRIAGTEYSEQNDIKKDSRYGIQRRNSI
ncbi:hypothetical protein WICMUC_003218 [Wickerhamomyces mucosus]|uniref:Lysophospholipase NTE1 n=1 Tax=Wickerhamomyces mucosus TaxID=1378264 RepID=A0A9P8TDQ2_9ASCO|nr:hypothetical protein WICMUC_003218 [Wickerhamomyces mucosus]